MKLIECLSCRDIIGLRERPRRCDCGESGGRYVTDLIVSVFGPCRILGIRNLDRIAPEPSPKTYPWFVIPEPHERIRRRSKP